MSLHDKPSSTNGDEIPSSIGQKSNWRSLIRFTHSTHYVTLSLAIIFAILSGVIVPALAYFLGGTFDAFTSFGAGASTLDHFLADIAQHAIYMVILGALNWFFSACFLFCWIVFGELQVKSARHALFACMLDKEMEWFDMRKSGISALMPRIQSQLRELQLATSQPMGFFCQYSCTILAGLGLAFYSAWDVTLVVIASAPIGAAVMTILSKRLRPHIERQASYLEISTKHASAAIKAIETVKCANAQAFELLQYLSATSSAGAQYVRQARLNAAQFGFVRFLTLAIFVQGFWYGSHLVQTGTRSSGQVFTAFWACLIATQTLEGLLQHMLVLEKGKAAGELLYSILTSIDDAQKIPHYNITPDHCDGDIQLANVSFAYPSQPSKPVLDDVTMFFASGETTFIVGKSGSGKSTLASLLLGFYCATGQITIDGKSIDLLDRNWLRNNITVMQQQSVLFNESILRNVAFGLRDFQTIGPADIEECIRYAALEDTIRDLTDGVNTLVGPGGNLMSGGQRQRIAFARAKLRDTPILIFDEATSALDRRSADIVMESIRSWRRNKTTIIITHDLSQVLSEDYVYAIDKGKVVQEGYRSSIDQSENGGFQLLMGTQHGELLSSIPVSPTFTTSFDDTFLSGDTAFASQPPTSQVALVAGKRTTMVTAWAPLNESFGTPIQRRVSLKENQNMKRLSTQFSSRHTFTRPVSGILQGDSLPFETKTKPSPQSRPEEVEEVEQDAVKDSEPQSILDPSEMRSLFSIVSTIWPNLFWRQRVLLLLGLLCAAAHAVATPVFSFVFSKLLGTYLNNDPDQKPTSWQWSLVVLGIAITDGILSYFVHYLLECQGQAWIDALRAKAYQRILDQPRVWFDEQGNNSQKLVDVLDRSAEEMRNLLGRFLGLLIVAITMIAVAVIWSLVLCWQLSLVGLACGPFIYALTSLFNTLNARWEKKCNDAVQPVSDSFTETFGSIRTVRALTLEAYFHHKHNLATRDAMAIGVTRAVYSGFFFGTSDAAILFVIALLFWYSSTLVAYHGVPVQTVMTVVSMLLFTLTSAAAMLTFIPQLNSSRDTATQLLRLVDLPLHTSHEHYGTYNPSELNGEVAVSNLTFTYPSRPQQPAVRGLSLNIHLNASTAIVGASGSGKSTLVSLLLGLYALGRRDAISISGIPIPEINIERLRSLVALSPQYPPIFPTSIRNNIAYALPLNSALSAESNVERAARLAGVDIFIQSLPQGYDTLIGEGGNLLSGGQTARIGLARAICRQPRLLILDEPTAGLDGVGRGELVKVIRQLVREKVAVLVVTHDEVLRDGCEYVVELKPSS